MTRPIDREIDCNITRNDRGQDATSPSEPIGNLPSKAGTEVESHDSTDGHDLLVLDVEDCMPSGGAADRLGFAGADAFATQLRPRRIASYRLP
jgi:hypothetical protein